MEGNKSSTRSDSSHKSLREEDFDSQLQQLGGNSMWGAMMGGHVESARPDIVKNSLAASVINDGSGGCSTRRSSANDTGHNIRGIRTSESKSTRNFVEGDSDDDNDVAGLWAAAL